MPKASIKRNINCSKKDLIDLVLNIEEYPKFIPYCLNAHIYKDESVGNFQYIEADLTIGKGPFKDTYKSDVKFDKKESIIYVKNIEGPLKYLENKWKFDQKENFTEVTFDLDFELKNKFLNIFMNKSFKYGLDKIADAFQSRAEKLFNKV
ncbi:type II toxin-antitoxin system RatA family toxin [Candidatus Pelagibacter sp.]|jgi:coenzyme Q-binding protein COQ10|nr:type II toxin-antitoxin system RatA family toxin [Candidatus Pelagibacter sp.]|tara:strand:+ start:1388 stop:1837 length:450 start_codon:yes stop_codon:yes gene_type:complete